MPLTDTACRNAKPRETAWKLSDEKGLYLLVKPAGKYWRWDYRHGGKRLTMALGVYPEINLKTARKRRDAGRMLLEEGQDPMAEKAAAKRTVEVEAASTFKAVAMEWHQMKAKSGHVATTVAKRLAHLETHVFPVLGDRPIAAIKASDILAMLRGVAAAGSAYTAGRLREICGQVFRYAIATDRAAYNPAADLRGAIETPAVNHRPALTTRREFGEFARDLLAHDDCHPLTQLAARFAMLTWTRPKELRMARWEHIDFEAREWRVPAADMKMGKHLQAHTVPLSAHSLSVLEQIREISGSLPNLFPSIRGGDGIMSENTVNLLFKKMGYAGRQSHHGLRASARSLLSERGWSVAALEAQLDHAERNKVVAAYARSEHLVERRQLMEDWGAFVASLEAGSNVVPLPQRAA
jgi:integrase